MATQAINEGGTAARPRRGGTPAPTEPASPAPAPIATDSAQPQPASHEPDDALGSGAQAPRRAWNDDLLRKKVMAIVAFATLGGMAVGITEARWGFRHWPMLVGLALVLGLNYALGRAWIWHPMEQLLDCWRRLTAEREPGALHELPIRRQDEVGQVARAMYHLAVSSIRNHYEAKNLRRTIDHRVAKATTTATRRLLAIAMRDPMTDLGNRRFLDETLEPLVASVIQSNSSLSAVLIDMDHFKLVNDRLGHAAGDELIVCLAGLIKGLIRTQDIAVRLGGDEFLVLLPGAGSDRADQFSQRLRHLFQQSVASMLDANPRPDLSVGVASMPHPAIASGKDLLRIADETLYQAKRSGRGRVVTAA